MTTIAQPSAETPASWILAGVVPGAEAQPAPVPADEPFNPLAGVSDEA